MRAVRFYPERSPLTFGYVCVLLLTHGWLSFGMSAEQASVLLEYISTNLTNLADHPISALLGSALFFNGTLTHVMSLEFAGTLLTLGLGIGCFLARAEYRWGRFPAFAVFLAGHVGATLLTALVIRVALRHGWYGDYVRDTLDYGISYGAQTVMAASTPALPRSARLPWIVFLFAWPFAGAEWYGALPDFTTIGHLFAAALGFAFLLARPESRFRNPRLPKAPHE
ncbi:rhomboid-like protein [Streptomyces sp. NPDC127178]|uniref:rhomboid-like protein n=1 Tax=unclassified Streptomyces TaxID=2593676 RepID=UPI00363C0CB0